MRILKNLRGIANPELATNATQNHNASGEKLCRLLSSCPICNNIFLNHTYILFATIVLGEERKDRVIEFFRVLKDHRWSDFQKFQEWESISDNAEAFLVRCVNNQLAMLVLRSPTELYEPDSLVTVEILNQEESSKLEQFVIQSEWRLVVS